MRPCHDIPLRIFKRWCVCVWCLRIDCCVDPVLDALLVFLFDELVNPTCTWRAWYPQICAPPWDSGGGRVRHPWTHPVLWTGTPWSAHRVSPANTNIICSNKLNFDLQNQVLQLRWWKRWVEGTNGPDEEERLQVSWRVLPGGHPSLPWQICPSWRRWSWLQLLVRKNPLLETHPCISHFITFRKSNPDILKFMTALNISGEFSKLESIYIHKLLDIVGSLPTRNGYIIWQVEIIKETIISYVFQLSIMFCF